VRILHLALHTAAGNLQELADFYGGRLGLDHHSSSDRITIQAGATEVEFHAVSNSGSPFYHFAIRIPHNRFAVASKWLDEGAGLLENSRTHETAFDFKSWNAEACYAHDPAGNIVELIAHHELPEETPNPSSDFHARELLGVCEIGLVDDDVLSMGRALQDLGIELWDGTLEEGGGLAFMGGRDGVLILAATGRGWLPTGRPSEPHPVDVAVEGPGKADRSFAHHRVRVT
jgi:catechol 2,3-dioxygenase-like lactoylglutathione lyase family enzyme